ncbi:unnamed protein product [Ectocarpus sp. 8 AP-2014]
MGDSEKIDNSGPNSYTIPEHASYLFALLEALGVTENVTLVIHDWGSGLGFHWAETHRDAVKGIAFMEGIVTTFPTWDHFNKELHGPIKQLRGPEGEKMALEDNFFIEKLLPGAILRDLSEEEHAAYRKPFLEAGEARRPTLAGPRSLPIEGDPADSVAIIEAYGAWLAASPVPKLFINAEPGAFLVGHARDVCRSWPNVTEVTVAGSHFIQEDSPAEIVAAITNWLPTIEI